VELRPGAYEGARNRVLRPIAFGNIFVGVLAIYYVYLTMGLAQQVLPAFWTMLALSAVVPGALARFRIGRNLTQLREVELGDETVTKRVAALGELQRLPDVAGAISLQHWVATLALIALGVGLVIHGTALQLARVALWAVLFAPVAAAVVDLLVMRSSAEVIRALSVGLSPSEVVRAIPTTGDRLRMRLVVFTAVLVVLPAVAIVDASHQLGASELTQLATSGATAEALSHARWVIYGNLALLLFAVAAGGLLIASAGSTVIANPLRLLAEDARKLGKGEQISARVYPATDEVWGVTANFGVMVDQLNHVVGEVKRTVTRLGSTTVQMSKMSGSSEALAAEQATALNETSATTEELATSARQISSNASSVEKSAQKTLEAAKTGQNRAEEFFRAVDRMRDDNRAISEAVQRLNARVQQIGKVVEFITGVADRSDLLALSAELEGTKAGDLGRGFTLVAAEMRRLAENVIESTKEIEELIDEIRQATDTTVEATERGLQQTLSGTALATQVAGVLDQVVQLAERTSEEVRAISLATQQQQSGTDQLAEAMADILGITQQSLAATKQLSQANSQLVALTGTLGKLVAEVRFGA
jgi:methyl-accepting chemotaxis protein